MSIHCDADYDVSCSIRDNHKAGQDPQCAKCAFRLETYDPKLCKCGTKIPPRIYEEGYARRWIRNKHEKSNFEWVGESRFAVKCPSCSAASPLMESPEAAVSEWNKYCEAHPEDISS